MTKFSGFSDERWHVLKTMLILHLYGNFATYVLKGELCQIALAYNPGGSTKGFERGIPNWPKGDPDLAHKWSDTGIDLGQFGQSCWLYNGTISQHALGHTC